MYSDVLYEDGLVMVVRYVNTGTWAGQGATSTTYSATYGNDLYATKARRQLEDTLEAFHRSMRADLRDWERALARVKAEGRDLRLVPDPYYDWKHARPRCRRPFLQLAAPRRPVHVRRERLPMRSRPGRRRRARTGG